MTIFAHPVAATVLLLIAAHGGGLSVQHSWFRYLDAEVPAGGYLTLRNDSATPAELTAASSPACGKLMLHESVSHNGVDTMHPVASITVPAHGTFAFSPGRYHLMCMHPKMRIGENVPVTLRFKVGKTLTATFPVFGPAGPPRASSR
ncbi:MAG: copper chaperone PCu(A)C [Acetobacteraceae bacterium]